MSFIQPWLLLGLPLVLLPIIIHLVNQWRYQTKPWGAMMFLLAAKSMHRGLARLRQWLILAMRVLALLGLIVAVSRPLASGVMGLLAAGRVDTVIVMIDRSPSMLMRDPRSQESKLATCLRQLGSALEVKPANRWILIDSANAKPQEFASLAALVDAPLDGGTSAEANWPSMFQQALDYLETNRPVQSDIWICSDMQASDWQLDVGPWAAIREEFVKLPFPIRCFNLAYSDPPAHDLAVRVDSARLEQRELDQGGEAYEVVLSLVIDDLSPDVSSETIPLQITLGGSRIEVPVPTIGGRGEPQDYRIPVDRSIELGWGRASLPSDDNPGNNESYFVFDRLPPRHTLIVCEAPELIVPIKVAAAISQANNLESKVSIVAHELAFQASFDDCSLIVWQGPLPQGELSERLDEHLQHGGALWLLPPRGQTTGDTSADGRLDFHGFRWGDWKEATPPLQPKFWRTDDGLLAATESGMSLPVGELLIDRFRVVEGDVVPLASLAEQSILFGKINSEQGHLYVCSTLPQEGASTLATNGVVLFVAMQRSLEEGSRLLGRALAIDASSVRRESGGKRLALPPADEWLPIVTDDRFLSTESGVHSGVYDAGSKWLAVNRPATEDEPRFVDKERLTQSLSGLEIVRIDDTAGSTRRIQNEIWRVFLVLMILALVAEAYLSLPRKLRASSLVPS